jgi:hypothetical protein
MDDQILHYERDGSVLLIRGDVVRRIEPGWTPAALDAAAADFFAAA